MATQRFVIDISEWKLEDVSDRKTDMRFPLHHQRSLKMTCADCLKVIRGTQSEYVTEDETREMSEDRDRGSLYSMSRFIAETMATHLRACHRTGTENCVLLESGKVVEVQPRRD